MRSIPVDTSNAMIMLALLRGPKMKNRKTGELATDADTGATLMIVDVTFIADGAAEVLSLSVPEPGIPEGLTPGMPVRLTGLVARPWENTFDGEKRSGVAFRAAAVTAAVPMTAKG